MVPRKSGPSKSMKNMTDSRTRRKNSGKGEKNSKTGWTRRIDRNEREVCAQPSDGFAVTDVYEECGRMHETKNVKRKE